MKALEFVTQIKEKQIVIPENKQSELEYHKDKRVRVILLFEQNDHTGNYDNDTFIQQTIQEQFLEGYTDSDSIYDKI